MNSSQTLPILLNLVAALLGAAGQFAYKMGGLRLASVPLHRNYALWSGVLLFCGVMALFVWGYKAGGRISVVYPFYATTFVWGALIGHFFADEPLNPSLLWGTGFILTGLFLIARGLESPAP